MNYKIGLLILFPFIVCACAAPKQPPSYDINKTEASLAEASYAVSRSVVDVAEVTQAAHPMSMLTPPPSPATYGMAGLGSVDWSGPVEPLVKQIAKATDYRVRVLGRPPAIPVLVTIYTKHAMLGDLLRDVGYQCGERANIVVFPESRVIELRYAKA